jgi:hypothetical protein
VEVKEADFFFSFVVLGLNLGPHACWAGTLQFELSPSPLLLFFFCNFYLHIIVVQELHCNIYMCAYDISN